MTEDTPMSKRNRSPQQQPQTAQPVVADTLRTAGALPLPEPVEEFKPAEGFLPVTEMAIVEQVAAATVSASVVADASKFFDEAPAQQVQEQDSEPAAPEPPATPAEATRYRVELKCPTPLRAKVLEVECATESEAWDKFCVHNGISGSSCDRDIRKVTA